LRIAIASHIVIDSIQSSEGTITESIGGPSCYCGITSSRFGFDVCLVTKVGKDFPKELRSELDNHKIVLRAGQIVDAPTTRFKIIPQGDVRQILLIAKCKPLSAEDIQDMEVDCWIASPVIDELPEESLSAIKQNKGRKNFIMLDPQGYLRLVDGQGYVTVKERVELDLSGINAIKVDRQEMAALTGGLQGLTGMQDLQLKGIEFVIFTERQIFHLLHNKMHYWVRLPEIDTLDSTGAGDVLCASFACSYIKERDPLWAICFGAAAVKEALETRQIGAAKVPSMSSIEQSASYFYNTIGFQRIS
jgi:sugar/nucleoside kinase (ribokinase family)